MRYRRLSYRYTMVVGSSQTWPLGVWQNDRLRLVDLAGVEEDDLDVQLFEGRAGRRRAPPAALVPRGGRVPCGRDPPGPVPGGAGVAAPVDAGVPG
jgi:hypothetical protein